jgi:hypothetical protein
MKAVGGDDLLLGLESGPPEASAAVGARMFCEEFRPCLRVGMAGSAQQG